MTPDAIVQKLWNYCNILRNDGLSYQDYNEQLTFMLILKMADERQMLFADRALHIPRELDWQSLERLDGEPLDSHYRHIGRRPLDLEREAILRDRQHGQSLGQIAKTHRISRATVHRVIHEEMPTDATVPKEV
jgi:hypothetical protein